MMPRGIVTGPMRAALLGLALCGALAATDQVAAGDGRPAWVEDPDAVYTPYTHMVGTGTGETAEEAVAAARADLAAGFRSRVRSTTTVLDDVNESFAGAGNEFARKTQTRRATKIESDEELANVVVGGTWVDAATGRHHAVVYVERRDAEQVIGADLHDCRLQLGELLDCRDCYPDPIAEYAAAVRAADLHVRYEVLSAQLRVVSSGRAGEIDPDLGPRVETRLDRARQQLILRIEAAPPELTDDLRRVLMDAGFVVVTGAACYTAELTFATSEAQTSQPFVFENWELTLRIRTAADVREIVTLSSRDRAGHKTRAAALERCLREARRALDGDISAELARAMAGGS